MKKYLVIPGYVVSKNDGDRHFINSDQLMRLYGVKQEECVFYSSLEAARGKSGNEKLIILVPRPDGKYNLPKLDGLRTRTGTDK